MYNKCNVFESSRTIPSTPGLRKKFSSRKPVPGAKKVRALGQCWPFGSTCRNKTDPLPGQGEACHPGQRCAFCPCSCPLPLLQTELTPQMARELRGQVQGAIVGCQKKFPFLNWSEADKQHTAHVTFAPYVILKKPCSTEKTFQRPFFVTDLMIKTC